MGYIKEPKGVNFLIKSPPLTKIEKQEISEFIKESKLKRNRILKKNLKKKEVV